MKENGFEGILGIAELDLFDYNENSCFIFLEVKRVHETDFILRAHVDCCLKREICALF